MKNSSILLFVFPLLLMGCSSSENTSGKQNMQVVNATYELWSKPPAAGSEIPEKGVDLTITVRNWPQGYDPQHIVYNGHKSHSAAISTKTDSTVIITGRIIRTSSLLVDTSEPVEVSDRLVFSNSKGNTGFLEIKNWNKQQ